MSRPDAGHRERHNQKAHCQSRHMGHLRAEHTQRVRAQVNIHGTMPAPGHVAGSTRQTHPNLVRREQYAV